MYLTSAKYRGIIAQVASSDGYLSQSRKKYQKNEKTFKKGIDKWEMMWYNIKVAAQSGDTRSLKIEQQERSTKLKNSMCIGSRTIQKRILLKQKVKLLRAKAR